MKSGSNKHSN